MVDSGADGPRVRVVWGTGTGPTDVAAYDAALADAGVHDYNLATVSSIVPPEAVVDVVGTAPALGPPGGRLWTVQARGTVAGPGRASAALGWATGDGAGVFYEAGGAFDEAVARERVLTGLEAARVLRDRDLPGGDVRSVSVSVPEGAFGAAVVLGIYGESEPMV